MKFTEYLESPVFWLRRAWLATDRTMNEAMESEDLSSAQFEVLCQLWQEDGLEQRALQARLRVSSATLTGVIDSLTDRELAERRLSPHDARIKQLFLTERGKALEHDLGVKMERIQACLLVGLTDSEQIIVKEWLHKMAQNISDPCE